MKARLIIGGVLLLAIAVAGWWLHDQFEYVTEDVPVSPRGAAAYNPLYAAARALEAYGFKTVTLPYLDFAKMRLHRNDTVVFAGDVRALTPSQLASLRTTMQQGVRLLTALPDSVETGLGPFGAAFGVEAVLPESPCPKFTLAVGQVPLQVPVCGPLAVKSPAGGAPLYYDTRPLKSGRLTLLSSLRFMDNELLHNKGNAAFMLHVLDPDPAGRVFFIYSVDVEPLPLLVVKHGWPVLLALALLIAAYLLSVGKRLGPFLPPAEPPRRALLEHVAATGRLLWRSRAERALFEAVKQDVLARLQRRHAGAQGRLAAYLAQLTHIPQMRVRQALGLDGGEVRESFLVRISTLIKIRNRL